MPPPVFFVSYARADTQHSNHRNIFEFFVEDLSAEVAIRLNRSIEDVVFIDRSSIKAGYIWPDKLREALSECQVGLALYTPNYFNQLWCGREFQVFLQRRKQKALGTGIVPVLWIRSGSIPTSAVPFQYKDCSFPPEYESRGMSKLVELRSVDLKAYVLARDALVDRIVAEAGAQHLESDPNLDLESVESAWDVSNSGDPISHTRGGVSKACFVFVAKSGWDWVPYQESPASIGALAQTITGELGLRFEEIPCDRELPRKLKETYDNDVPTVLFGDPSSLNLPPFSEYFRHYDSQYLLNCAALIPWEPSTKETIESDPRWIYFKTKVCKQKAESQIPAHEWKSIFNRQDLDQRTKYSIEYIRSRIMKTIISDPIKAQNTKGVDDKELAEAAASIGINTNAIANLEGPSR